MINKGSKIIKTFCIVFNYFKSLKYDDTHIEIFFNVGNAGYNPNYDNFEKRFILLLDWII